MSLCGDYHLVNKWTHLNKYVMPLLKEIFDAFSQAKVFNTLDLKSSYHISIAIEGRWEGQDNILGNWFS
jgi:hypothetical protein